MKWTAESKFYAAVSVVVVAAVSAPFVAQHVLYGDGRECFVLFRDYFQSINRFGEIAQWLPQYSDGWPGIYYLVLGYHGVTPLILLEGAAIWALGRLGLMIDSYYYLYVAHHFVFVPLIVAWGVYSISQKLYPQSPRTRQLVFILALVSPGLVCNLGDIGFLEKLGYWLLLADALLSAKSMNQALWNRYFGFALCCVILSLGFTAVLSMVLVSLPLLMAFAFDRNAREAVLTRFRGIHRRALVAMILGAVVCLGPLVFVFQIKPELYAVQAGGSAYSAESFAPGSPLELVYSGTPTVGFQWVPKYRETWTPVGHTHRAASYGYLGSATLVLAIGALFCAPRKKAVWYFSGTLLALFAVFVEGRDSQIFRLIHSLHLPINLFNHFNDASFRVGGYLLVIFLAGFAFEAMTGTDRLIPGKRAFFCVLYASFVALALYTMTTLNKESLFTSTWRGVYLAVSALTLVAFAWLLRAKDEKAIEGATVAVLIVLCLDVVIFVGQYVRYTVFADDRPLVRIVEREPPSHVGLVLEGHSYYAAVNIFRLKSTQECSDRGQGSDGVSLLTLTDSLPTSPVKGGNAPVLDYRRTFNKSFISIDSEAGGYLTIRDGYSKFWRLKVNGRDQELLRGMCGLQTVKLDKGKSSIELSFSVPFVSASIVLATLAFMVALGLLVAGALLGAKPEEQAVAGRLG